MEFIKSHKRKKKTTTIITNKYKECCKNFYAIAIK